ncbi:unnamed protein product [Umbelopsis ramanniana]
MPGDQAKLFGFVLWCGEETVRMEVPSKQKTLFQTYPIPTSWIRKTFFKETRNFQFIKSEVLFIKSEVICPSITYASCP